MLLSIGMIVKNEEKYLDQCLSALKPILKSVDSELIIADTGSTDRTVEIAKKYTDNVYHFEWINDFAAARNSTLEKAEGEWFMFIDADEIAENCDDIIRFFNSGEYKKYNSGTYVQRSYAGIVNGEVDKSDYSDFRPLRLAKKTKELVFSGAIHETFERFYDPVKHLDLIADHYGYIFYNDGKLTKFAIEKGKRNLVPLLERAKKLKPPITGEVGVYKEIADCYALMKDYDKVLEYMDKGLQEVDKNDLGIIVYYPYKADALSFLKRYDEIISLCDRYFSNANPARKTELATDTVMYFFRAAACHINSRYQEALTDLCKFFDTYDRYAKGKLNTNDLLYSSMCLSRKMLGQALQFFYDCCVKTNNYEAADRYKMPYPISGMFVDQAELSSYVQLKTAIMKNNGFGELPQLYSQLDEPARKILLCNLRWVLFEAEDDKRRDMIKNLESAAKKSPESEAVAIIRDYFLNGTANAKKAEEYLKKYGSSYNADILYILLDKKADITQFVCAKDFAANECVHAVYDGRKDFFTVLENYEAGSIASKEGLEKTAELYKFAIALAAKQRADITALMKKYGEIGLKWQKESGESACPREIEAASWVNRITSAFEEKDYRLCRDEIQRFLEKFQEFILIMKFYREAVDRAEKESAASASKPLSEFEQMAIAVKQSIRNMIKSGNISEAESTLSEYRELCPDDIEIKALEEEINKSK